MCARRRAALPVGSDEDGGSGGDEWQTAACIGERDADEYREDDSGGGYGGGGGGGGGYGGSGNDDDDDNDDDHRLRNNDENDDDGGSGGIQALLKSRGFTWDDVAPDVRGAYERGAVSAAAVANYVHSASHPVTRFLMNSTTGGMRSRFLADRLFLAKILIEEGLGIFGKLSAEYSVRRERFFDEIDFVFANVLMALLADFALVYFPAPSVSLGGAARASASAGPSSGAAIAGVRGWIARAAGGLPSNVFQTDRAYSMQQRLACYVYKVAQLFVVGTACAAAGVSVTNALIAVRQRLEPSFKPQNVKSNVLFTSAMYGVFLGLSSGSRYQLVNGVELHLFPRLLRHAPPVAEAVATYFLRWGNTFWGSQQWAVWARLVGAQKSGGGGSD